MDIRNTIHQPAMEQSPASLEGGYKPKAINKMPKLLWAATLLPYISFAFAGGALVYLATRDHTPNEVVSDATQYPSRKTPFLTLH